MNIFDISNQVFDNTPASREGTLQSGDELVGVNGQSVKGKTKVEVAKMIQSAKVCLIQLINTILYALFDLLNVNCRRK